MHSEHYTNLLTSYMLKYYSINKYVNTHFGQHREDRAPDQMKGSMSLDNGVASELSGGGW